MHIPQLCFSCDDVFYRWPGTVLPVVKFVNGREEVLLPEVFTADVAAVGVCKRLQVSLADDLPIWIMTCSACLTSDLWC